MYLASEPLGPALVAKPNISLTAHTMITPAGVERLLTLQSSPC